MIYHESWLTTNHEWLWPNCNVSQTLKDYKHLQKPLCFKYCKSDRSHPSLILNFFCPKQQQNKTFYTTTEECIIIIKDKRTCWYSNRVGCLSNYIHAQILCYNMCAILHLCSFYFSPKCYNRVLKGSNHLISRGKTENYATSILPIVCMETKLVIGFFPFLPVNTWETNIYLWGGGENKHNFV